MARHDLESAATEFQSQFAEAEAALAPDLAHVIAQLGSNGGLGSPRAVYTGLAKAMEARTTDAVTGCLAAIDRATTTPGKKREAMAARLAELLAVHWGRMFEIAWDRIGDPNWTRSRDGFSNFTSPAGARVAGLIDRYERGWTDAEGQHWTERYPVAWEFTKGALTFVIGAIVGMAVLPKIDLRQILGLG